MKLTQILIVFFCLNVVLGSAHGKDQLIVFENGKETRVQQLFHKDVLQKIVALASKQGVELVVKKSTEGVPSEITTLPAIVYQNALGRSVYRGRFSQISRIGNFIRTSKFISQKKSPLTFDQALVDQQGRATIVYPVKIASATGTKPNGYDDLKFKSAMREAIAGRLSTLKSKSNISLQPLDKRFYFDFYPWVSKKGVLYLSGKIFSQHHCKKYIWSTKTPIVGAWGDRSKSFSELAGLMASGLKVVLANDVVGDSFDIILNETPTKSWVELGLKLPKKKAGSKVFGDIKVPLVWQTKGKLGPDSSAQFSIPPPNDNYSGFVSKVDGEFQFSKGGKLSLSKGWFEADMLSVSMGEPDLDESLLEEDMFFTAKFAKSKMVFSPIDSSEVGQLKLGEESQVTVKGAFSFKGINELLDVDLSFEPVIGSKGAVRLFVKAQFEIDLTKYGMEGAPGKHAKRNTIKFFIRIFMDEKK